MNLYRIIWHYLTTFVDGFGRTQSAEASGPYTTHVVASTSANAVAALQASLTVPTGQTFTVEEVIPLDEGGNVIIGS